MKTQDRAPQTPLVSIGTQMDLAGQPIEVVEIARNKVTVKTESGCLLDIDPQHIEQEA